jgi:hypothetical protein
VLDTPQVQAYLPVRGKGPLKILYLTRVLFAADGSELAIEAARRAAGMLADFEATVLGAVPPLPLASDTAVAGFESVALPVTSPETVAEIDESVTATIEAGIERTITAIGRPASGGWCTATPRSRFAGLPRRAGSTLSSSDRTGRGSSSRCCWDR